MEQRKIRLPFEVKKPILALGAQTKNTICFAKGKYAYLSPVHLDLSNPRDSLDFEKKTKYFLKKNPKIIAYDLHPEYQSTKYTLQLNAKRYTLYAIQHHHAHITSCMVENGLKNQRVIGVAFDGTGMGDDNNLWGAEFLICDYSRYERKAHLRYIPLIGADKAIWQPWRLAIFWLYLIYQEKLFDLKIDFIKKIDKKNWLVLKKMYDSKFNSPLVSSMGRLFDSVASLVLNKIKVKFEAELAIELEKAANKYSLYAKRYTLNARSYSFKTIKEKEKYIINPLPMFKEIIADLKAKEAKEKIAFWFHLAVAQIISKICLILRGETKINRIVLSGGVFQNELLLRLSLDLLYKAGFKVFIHKYLSCNDSSISLGQVAIANFKYR